VCGNELTHCDPANSAAKILSKERGSQRYVGHLRNRSFIIRMLSITILRRNRTRGNDPSGAELAISAAGRSSRSCGQLRACSQSTAWSCQTCADQRQCLWLAAWCWPPVRTRFRQSRPFLPPVRNWQGRGVICLRRRAINNSNKTKHIAV
jgi:hypothetical protein